MLYIITKKHQDTIAILVFYIITFGFDIETGSLYFFSFKAYSFQGLIKIL